MNSDINQAVTGTNLGDIPLFKSGKVRDVYDLGEHLLLVATDRISAFDCVLPDGIPDKGKVLNQLSAWWFRYMEDEVEHHLVSTDAAGQVSELAPFAGDLKGRSMLIRKTRALPVECVVRGYLVGSGWKEYCGSQTVSGIGLRAGYQMADRLDSPIFTPSTKAETGHDENIDFDAMCREIGPELSTRIRDISLNLYNRAAEYARERGIIIADTKFEFGLDGERIVLIDEALTPDSSRFWPAKQYQPGSSPPSFDKQYVRDYLETLDWDKTPPAPALPAEVIRKTRDKYLQSFEILTGGKLDT